MAGSRANSFRRAARAAVFSAFLAAAGSASAGNFASGPKLIGTGVVGTASSQGYSVALSANGNTALVGGASDNSDVGGAWVFTRAAGVWSQQGTKLVGTGAVGAATHGTAAALSADGNTALVGASQDNSNVGAAWGFTGAAGI